MVAKEMYQKIGDYMIRDWRKEDAPSIARYANNRKIWLNLRDAFPSPYSLKDAENFLARVIEADSRTVVNINTHTNCSGVGPS